MIGNSQKSPVKPSLKNTRGEEVILSLVENEAIDDPEQWIPISIDLEGPILHIARCELPNFPHLSFSTELEEAGKELLGPGQKRVSELNQDLKIKDTSDVNNTADQVTEPLVKRSRLSLPSMRRLSSPRPNAELMALERKLLTSKERLRRLTLIAKYHPRTDPTSKSNDILAPLIERWEEAGKQVIERLGDLTGHQQSSKQILKSVGSRVPAHVLKSLCPSSSDGGEDNDGDEERRWDGDYLND